MSGDTLTRLIASGSAFIALSSLCWTIAAWRMAGPDLRFHCLWYRQALVIRVFNAGRIADSVEQMELGGRDRTALTTELNLPARIEPGQSCRWVVSVDDLPEKRVRSLDGGWCSLWTLTGSMRQRRAEIVPMPQEAPPETGWRLVPRRAKLSRFAPLAAALVAVVLCTPAPGLPGQVLAWTAGAALSAWALFRLFATSVPQYARRKVERRLAVATLVAGLIGYGALHNAPDAAAPFWLQLSTSALLGVGIFLAVPRLGDSWSELPANARDALERASRRITGRPLSTRARADVGVAAKAPAGESRRQQEPNGIADAKSNGPSPT